jgi:preprotein translocase subunit SecF
MRIFEHANFAFVPKRKYAYLFSGTLILVSLLSLLTRGVEMGIDFKGGMEFVVQTTDDLSPNDVRAALTEPLGMEPEVKTFGDRQLLIRTSATGDIDEIGGRVMQGIESRFAGSQPSLQKRDAVGPRFAEDLQESAIYSILGSLLVIFIYILIRFEWRYGLGGIAALFHDVTVTLGLFSLLHGIVPFSLSIDQSIIAAFLTIVGYSINDTVVIFDRIREYNAMFKTERYDLLVNRAINSTLSRTIITSTTVLLTVIVLFIFGGEVLRGFAFALIVGVITGSYSTIFVAAPIVIELKASAAGARRK